MQHNEKNFQETKIQALNFIILENLQPQFLGLLTSPQDGPHINSFYSTFLVQSHV